MPASVESELYLPIFSNLYASSSTNSRYPDAPCSHLSLCTILFSPQSIFLIVKQLRLSWAKGQWWNAERWGWKVAQLTRLSSIFQHHKTRAIHHSDVLLTRVMKSGQLWTYDFLQIFDPAVHITPKKYKKVRSDGWRKRKWEKYYFLREEGGWEGGGVVYLEVESESALFLLTLFTSAGGHIVPPLSRICV